MMLNIRVLIVDDSILFRSQIQAALSNHPYIEIVGVASNGKIAIQKLQNNSIDLCILDVEMPVMDGIETLKEMNRHNIKSKVIMFSAQSMSGANKTVEALSLGALDFVTKPILTGPDSNPSEKIKDALLPRILSIFGGEKIQETKKQYLGGKDSWENVSPNILVIASSTGGPNALADFFTILKDQFIPFPILIVQHMPPLFTAALAQRLGSLCNKTSGEAVHGEQLKSDQIYIAPGDFHMRLAGSLPAPTIQLSQDDRRNYVRPCADYLFETAATIYRKSVLGIVMTGMGRDGADGAFAVKSEYGSIFIQNEESCVVFGMAGAVLDSGCYDAKGDPVDLARKVLLIAQKKSNRVA